MQISKTLAESVAALLLEKNTQRVKDQQQKVKDLGSKMVASRIPIPIKHVKKAFSAWLLKKSHFYFSGVGISDYDICCDEHPAVTYRINMDREESEALVKEVRILEDLRNELFKLKKDLIAALLALRTYKNIIEQFPEAATLLKERPKTLAVAVNIPQIRNQILK